MRFFRRGPARIVARRLLPAVIVIPILSAVLSHQGRMAGLHDDEIGLAAACLDISVLSLLVCVTAQSLHELDRNRRQTNGRLRAANAGLARQLRMRTKDLAAAEARLKKEITDRELVEEGLRKAREAAEASSRLKTGFLASMSHEIRTPLSAMLGYAELMLDPEQTSEELLECARVIQRNGEHLHSILNDMLDLSKIEAGKMTIERFPCSPAEIINDVISLMGLEAKKKNVGLVAEYGSLIPESIETDPIRLKQILLNLLGNAIKFTETGSINLLTTLIEIDRGNSRLCIEVIDSGIGIPPEQLKSLFRPFSQGESSIARKFGGTGLGLAISKQFARMLGGDIYVQSTPGEGTSFLLAIDASGVSCAGEENAALSEAEYLPSRAQESSS